MKTISALVFAGSQGMHHDHEGNGRLLVDVLSKDPSIEAELSLDCEALVSGLRRFDTTLFYTDVGALSDSQEAGLLQYIRGGGGFFGLHTADASFRGNGGYHDMLNGFFDGHSPYMNFTVNVMDSNHPICRGLDDFDVTDELHYLKHDAARSHALMTAYDPGTDKTHVMAYWHPYGTGRVFFFGLGHDMAVMQNPAFQEVVRRGVRWAAG